METADAALGLLNPRELYILQSFSILVSREECPCTEFSPWGPDSGEKWTQMNHEFISLISSHFLFLFNNNSLWWSGDRPVSEEKNSKTTEFQIFILLILETLSCSLLFQRFNSRKLSYGILCKSLFLSKNVLWSLRSNERKWGSKELVEGLDIWLLVLVKLQLCH